MDKSYINSTFSEGIFTITLNRPKKLNALCIEMVQELHKVINELANAKDLKVLFIQGNEKAFSAGGDLAELKSLDQAEAQRRSMFVQATFKKLQQLEVPVVALISGICFGGGLELALHTDFRFCSDTTRFALPEIKYGMIPGAGGTVQLPIQLNNADAAYYLLTGAEIPLTKALEIGLVQKVIPLTNFNSELNQLSAHFKNTSREALCAIKKMIQQARVVNLESTYNCEAELFSSLLYDNGRSGIQNNFIKAKE